VHALYLPAVEPPLDVQEKPDQGEREPDRLVAGFGVLGARGIDDILMNELPAAVAQGICRECVKGFRFAHARLH